MKKIVSLILIFVFLITLTIQATNVAAEDAPEVDPLTIQTLEEAEAALSDARSKLAADGFNLKLIQKIKQLQGRIGDLLAEGDGAKPTKCVSLFDQILGRTDKAIQQVSTMICEDSASQRVDITFYPMLEHCKSPFDTKCVCGHHPERPECMSGGGMSAMAEKCLSPEAAQLIIQDLQRSREALSKLQELDANADTVPDVCVKQ